MTKPTLTEHDIDLLRVTAAVMLAAMPTSKRIMAEFDALCDLAQAGLRKSEDAERYRFLRNFLDPDDYYSKWPRWTVAVESGGMGHVLRGDELDAAIDAARKETSDE